MRHFMKKYSSLATNSTVARGFKGSSLPATPEVAMGKSGPSCGTLLGSLLELVPARHSIAGMTLGTAFFNQSGILSAKSSPFFNILVKRIWLDESQALAVSQGRPTVRKSSHDYCRYSIGSL
jgi:hypothetical protein